MATTRTGSAQSKPVPLRSTRARNQDRTIEDIEAAAADGVSWLREQVVQNPWPMVGAAAAAGWLLGGGLTPRLVGVLLTTAGRLAMTDVVSAAIRGAVNAEPSASRGASDDA